MKNQILFLLVVISSFECFTQNIDLIYQSRGFNQGINDSYGISELIIHSDSTFTWKNYNVKSSKDWKDYKNHEPTIDLDGKINKKGKYYILTELGNSYVGKSDWKVKITEKSIVFFTKKKNGKHKRTTKYKRIKKASG